MKEHCVFYNVRRDVSVKWTWVGLWAQCLDSAGSNMIVHEISEFFIIFLPKCTGTRECTNLGTDSGLICVYRD